MNVLITGVSGYIAQYLLKTAPENCQITGTFYSPVPDSEKTKLSGINLIPLKLENNVFDQLQNLNTDVVIHAAAVSALAESDEDPERATRINSLATGELAAWAKQKGSRFIYLSTDIVFDGQQAPYQESDKPEPINPYGKSKLAGEISAQKNNPDAVIARLALVLGKGLGRKKNFVDWLEEHVRQKKTIPLFMDEIRTPINVKDAAKTIWKLAASDNSGIFHLCGTESVDRYALGVRICHYIDPQFSLFKKTSLKEMSYARPADVSMKDNRLGQIFNHSNPSAIDDISRLFNHDYS